MNIPAPDKNSLLLHRLSLLGYFGLLVFIPIWHLLWYPNAMVNPKVITLFWLVPLFFPLRGLLKGKAYTHAWSGFIATIYVCHALASYVTHPDEWLASSIELLLSSTFLVSATLFARRRGEQLGLQLPKRKENNSNHPE